jgi:hypothetical protein
MNLCLVSQTENDDWDTYDSFVVCASDAETARRASPRTGSPQAVDHDGRFVDPCTTWAQRLDSVTVQYIGVADDSVSPGVVCASFNAG